MVKKRGWWNPAKYIRRVTEGRCPYCHKPVKSIEAHVKREHKGEKLKIR